MHRDIAVHSDLRAAARGPSLGLRAASARLEDGPLCEDPWRARALALLAFLRTRSSHRAVSVKLMHECWHVIRVCPPRSALAEQQQSS